MLNIFFYGNCQTIAVRQTLNLSGYNIFAITCCDTDIDKKKFTDIINKSDIIITQPISDNYRDLDYLSTKYVINNSKKNSKIIIFDSCSFNFYYFDLTYKNNNKNNTKIDKPILYHYNDMIKCFENKMPIDYYINNYVNNMELKSSEELEQMANDSLNELYKRYENNKKKYNSNNIYVITCHKFIKENYKKMLLFYSMNHPTKYVIQYLCEKIIKFLKIPNTINYEIDRLNNPRCILYKCIQQNVNFDINNHSALVLDKTDIYEITKLYYDAYKLQE